jgi:hypothetical protein
MNYRDEFKKTGENVFIANDGDPLQVNDRFIMFLESIVDEKDELITEKNGQIVELTRELNRLQESYEVKNEIHYNKDDH